MLSRFFRSITDFYRLLTSGLNRAEIERFLKVDTRDVYAYYVGNMQRPTGEEQKGKRFLVFCKNLFLTFLMKLTPARRLLYAIAVVLFVFALINRTWSFAIYTFLLLNFLLALELADKLIEKDELVVARDIQLSLLPNHDTRIAGFDIATFSDVARNVGGDYYDFIPLNDGSTLVVIGDVSGKGISAALYMVKVQTMLQLFAKSSSDPRELLIRLNNYLYRQLKRTHFLTLALLKVFPDGDGTFCRAGHTPALLMNGKQTPFAWLEPGGAAIGIAPSMESGGDGQERHHRRSSPPEKSFEEVLGVEKVKLNPGDTLFLFTDGVVDTFNSHRQDFGEDRLAHLVSRARNENPESIKGALLGELSRFRGGMELYDDITFVIMKREA